MHISQPYPDKELLLLIADGDEKAFRQLFESYLPMLYPLIFKIVKQEAVAEDIFQETFLRLWIYRHKLPEIENPRAWIFRIAYHQAFTWLRKDAMRNKTTQAFGESAAATINAQETEQVLSFRKLESLVKEAIRKMPAQQQRVYLLSRERGLKTDEIAREMNLSVQSVKNTMVRALKTIEGYLNNAGVKSRLILVLIALLTR